VTLAEILALPILRDADWRSGIDPATRRLDGVGVVDHEHATEFVQPYQLVLTTGVAWPRDERARTGLLRAFAEAGVAAVGVATPKYVDRLPDAICRRCDAAGMPLFEIPWEIPFSEVTSAVHAALLQEQHHVAARSEELHRVLTRAAVDAPSLSSIARTLGRSLGCAARLEDAHGRLLGAWDPATGHVGDERASVERPAAAIEEPLRRAHRAARAVRIAAGRDGAGVAWAVCAIRLKQDVIGWVWLRRDDGPMTELDLRAAEHAALVAGLHIAHQKRIEETRAHLGSSFVDALLTGDDADPSNARSHRHAPRNLREAARALGFDVEGTYRLAVIALDVPVPLSEGDLRLRDRLADHVREAVRQLGATPFLAPASNRVFGVLPDAVDPDRFWALVHGHWPDDAPKIGMLFGRSAHGTSGVRRSHDELAPVLASVRFGRLLRYRDVLLPNALHGDRTAQELLVAHVFGGLGEHPALHTTLRTWARLGFGQARVAGALGLHVNSLRYRLKRVEALTGLDLDDPETRFNVQVAERLLSTIHESDGADS
jgi:purine catabolism regulator